MNKTPPILGSQKSVGKTLAPAMRQYESDGISRLVWHPVKTSLTSPICTYLVVISAFNFLEYPDTVDFCDGNGVWPVKTRATYSGELCSRRDEGRKVRANWLIPVHVENGRLNVVIGVCFSYIDKQT